MRESRKQKNRGLRRHFVWPAVSACMLMLAAGCGAKKESGLTVEEVKTAVLENAGLSEEQVRFVRIHLESDDGPARYEVEFLCETAEYDYTVDAGSGEILSMNCENGSYDIAAVPEDILRPDSGPAEQDMPQSGQQPQSEPQSGQQPQSEPQSEPQSGQQPQPESEYIGVDAAKQTALEHAGLQEEDVRFKHARLEFDDGYWKYEVEFDSAGIEYDYDIDARTGGVLSCDHESVHGTHGDTAAQTGDMITAEQAEQIALAYAGVDGNEAQYLKTELDYNDGRAEYEVEWYVGRTEYSCDVDAYTGEVMSFEKEWD